MTKEDKYNNMYMDIAARVAAMSYSKRLHVGSVIVKNDNIISFGWNGMPAGWDNNCEDELVTYDVRDTVSEREGWSYDVETKQYRRLKTKKEVLHAESNAIVKLSKSSESSVDSKMYCTHSPCIECAKLIFQSGVKNLYYRNAYRSNEGIDFLSKSGVKVQKI